jgi:hypothetical protein
MKTLGNTFTGPPKYLNQRDSPLEIPIEVVKNLFMQIDTNIDDRLTIDEISNYAQMK